MNVLLTPVLSLAIFAGTQAAVMAGDSVPVNPNQPSDQNNELVTALKTNNPQLFAKIDANHDNTINSSEIEALNDNVVGELNAYIETNATLKRSLDKNYDNTVSKKELSAMLDNKKSDSSVKTKTDSKTDMTNDAQSDMSLDLKSQTDKADSSLKSNIDSKVDSKADTKTNSESDATNNDFQK